MTKVGLAIMRLQPLTLGHTWIINQMISECETVIIGLGSTQAAKDEHNPWSFEDRKQMIRNVYGDRIKTVPFADLGTDSTTTDWCDYVLEKIHKLGLPDPTDYYTGSHSDGIWYKKKFLTDEEINAATRADTLNGVEANYARLNIRHRDATPYPHATEIRTFLRLKSDQWKSWVPRVNHNLVAQTFPTHLVTG